MGFHLGSGLVPTPRHVCSCQAQTPKSRRTARYQQEISFPTNSTIRRCHRIWGVFRMHRRRTKTISEGASEKPAWLWCCGGRLIAFYGNQAPFTAIPRPPQHRSDENGFADAAADNGLVFLFGAHGSRVHPMHREWSVRNDSSITESNRGLSQRAQEIRM